MQFRFQNSVLYIGEGIDSVVEQEWRVKMKDLANLNLPKLPESLENLTHWKREHLKSRFAAEQ